MPRPEAALIEIPRCPICDAAERTPVAEYNGLVLLDALRGREVARYDYALCHGCGLVYATRRPTPEQFDELVAHFHRNLGRTETDLVDYAGPVTPEIEAELRRRLAKGWRVSVEEGAPAESWLPALFSDRVNHSAHVDLIGSLFPVKGARVLEIRTRTGFLSQVCRDYLGAAEVCALPVFELQRRLIQEAFGVPCEACVDFYRLAIPYEGRFDLVIAREMVTHAVDLRHFFATLRERVRPGGYVYLFGDKDDSRLYRKAAALFPELRCFHLQQFDLPTYARVLRHEGFEPFFLRHPQSGRSHIVCGARRSDAARFEPIGGEALAERLRMYRVWRDESVLSLPAEAKALYGAELREIEDRGLREGHASLDQQARVRSKRRMRVMHAEGYRKLNAPRPGPQTFWNRLRWRLARERRAARVAPAGPAR